MQYYDEFTSIGELLFWLHMGVIILAVLSGLWLPTMLVFVLVVLHKIHLIVLGDCFLTKLKKYTKTIGKDEVFLQYAAKRFLGVAISKYESELINYTIYALTILLSLTH